MSDVVTLKSELRGIGTGAAKALRRAGKVPIVIYGNNSEAKHLAIEEKEVTKLYRKPYFFSTVIQIASEEGYIKVLPKEVQLDPITDLVRHADFVLVGNEIIKVDVPIIFEGKDKSIGIKRGGFFNVIKREISLVCPVNHIPQKISVDISNMRISTSIKVSQLLLPKGCMLAPEISNSFVIASMVGKAGKSDSEDESADVTKK